ncbi:hypothetical protein G9A89_019286 [Geosiphon pyriformis]|nr:hypothetical protein G9A89_019286 [Geosiphon pyriformis]
MDLKTALSGDMFKKKMPKSAFYSPIGGSFFQVVLGNIKHSDNERDVFLHKSGSGGMYLDLESEFSSKEDNIIMEDVDSGFFLGSATNTSKTKRVNTSVVLRSLLSSPNYNIDDDEVVLPPRLLIFLNKKWIDPKIIKISVEVSVKKSFTLNINLLAVEDKSVMTKTQLIRKIFSLVNGFKKTTTPSKFKEII